MNRTGYVLSVVLALLLPACHIESLHPLADPSDIRVDERLLGTWIGKDTGESNVHRLHIARNHGTLLHATWLIHQPSNQTKKIELEIAPTVIGARTYASIRVLNHSTESEEPSNYIFVRYSLDAEDVLAIWAIDLRPAVNERDLFAVRGRITATTEKLRKLMASHGDDFVASDTHLRFAKIADR